MKLSPLLAVLLGLATSSWVEAAPAFQYRVYSWGLTSTATPTVQAAAQALTFILSSSASLPAATRGVVYNYDLKSLLAMSGDGQPALSAVTWNASSPLPTGLTLSTAGVLSGTPDASGTTALDITATYQSALGVQSYTLVVNGQALDVTQVATGGAHSCALLTNHAIKCWGRGDFGQLGNGGTTSSANPVSVISLGGTPVQITAGYVHTCARLSNGTAQCWGRNDNGQLGVTGVGSSASPVTVMGVGGVGSLTNVTQVATSHYTTCFVANSAAYCAGNNNWYNLGTGATGASSTPVAVKSLTGTPAQVAPGDYHTCVLNTAGAVQCWGYNASGQVGDGTVTTRTAPVTAIANGAVQVSAHQNGVCATMSNGTVKCWGINNVGQNGDNSSTNRSSPVQVSGLTGVTAVARGPNASCAIQGTGIKCWGAAGAGALGSGTTVGNSLTPVTTLNITAQPTSISMGADNFGCAALASGSARCWGFNSYSQLGDGSITTRSTPVTPGL